MHIFQIITYVIILKQLFTSDSVNIGDDYMALSHKDWELPNSRIWLAKIDIDRGLDCRI